MRSTSASVRWKSKSSKFSRDPLRGHRLREHDVAELQVPAQHDLAGGSVVRRGDLGERGVVEHLALGERAPGLGDDPAVGVLAPQAALLEARVELDLVHRRA